MHQSIARALAAGAVILLAAGTLHGQLAITDSVRTFSSLTNTTVTLTGKSELHVTGTSNPISGSTIHLNSHDSWFWLDNIRPSTVSSNYLSQIRVNGAAAVHGGNVRIVQYGMGTLVTPFTNAEQPLETFTDPGFRGESKRFGLYTYHNTTARLGAMHRNISSFKLKRGFMATFATEPNGRGVSRIYIAQDHDVNIGNLPGNLNDAVQYVRVFPWRWVSKKGSCDVAADTLDAAWFYNWNNDRNSTLNWEYVPIKQQRWWPAYPNDKTGSTHLLGYNEPDNPIEDSYQTLNNGSRDAAIAAWPELLECGLRVGAPAVTDGGKWWLFDFMNKANASGLRVDYIPVHFYRCGMSATQLKDWLQDIWDRYQKPIWVTEFNNGANWTNCGDPTYNQNADVIASWIDMMDNTPWIERYAVYSNVESVRNMVYSGGGLTPAGTVYKANKSPIGYIQEKHHMAVKRGIVQLPLDGHTRDTSGHDNGGISHGAPDFAEGYKGQAIRFDGSNRYLSLPMGIVNSSSFTFGAWVYWNGGSSGQRIFDFGNSTDQFLFLSPGISGQMRLGLRNGSGTTTSISTTALPAGSWQHVAVTVQGASAKIYLNGILQAQGSLPDPALSGTLRNFIGKSQWSSDPLFNGRIDEVVLIDSALTEGQIAGLMTGITSPFVAHWQGDVNENWSTNITGDTNWTTDPAGSTDVGQLPAGNTEVEFSSLAGNSPNTVLGADFSIESLIVTTPSAVGIGGTHDLTIGVKGIYVGNGAGALAIRSSGRVHLATDQSWVNNSPNTVTVESGLSGSSRLTVSGSGTIALNGPNDWTGGLSVVGGGSVSVPSLSDSLATASQILLGGSGSTGALVYTGSGETSDRVLTFQGGFGSPGMVIDQSGTGLLKLTSAPASVSTVSKTITLQGSTSGEGEISAVISNSGSTTSLIKTGTGKWTLSAANTYSGTSILREGTLAIGSNSALSTGSVDLRGAAIMSSDATQRILNNAITLSADSSFIGTGGLLFTGAVNAGALSKMFTVDNPLTEFSGVISGSGARVKAGSGTLVLSGTNTYTGATTVSAGTLQVSGSLHAASAVTVANGATLTGTGTIHGPVSFTSGSRLGWSLVDHESGSAHLKTGPINVAAGASVDLIFDKPGSTVDFTDGFWTQIRSWPVLTSNGTTGTFTLGTISHDSQGNSINEYGTFHLHQNPQGLSLFFAPEGLEPPAPPTGFATTATRNEVKLSWNESEGATSYLILRSLHPGGPYEAIATVVSGTTYRDRTVVNGTKYYYSVASANPNGISASSTETTATPHLPTTVDKADNTADLNLAHSWTGGMAPTELDTARWIGLADPATHFSLGSECTWNRIVIGETGGAVTIGGDNTLTLGHGGIDMSAATQDLNIGSHLRLGAGHQSWILAADRTLALSTPTFTRNTGTTLNIRGPGTVSSQLTALINDSSSGGGIVGPWASVGTASATAYASLDGTQLVAFNGATAAANFGWSSSNPSTNNYDVGSLGGALGVSRTANTTRYTGAAGTQTWGNSADNVTITLNGLMNAGSGTLTFAKGGTGSGTGVLVGANRELVLHAANAGIAISAPIFNHSTGASALTIVGPGGVTLSGANSYTGGTHIGSGSLNVTGGNLGSGPIHITSGAALNLSVSQTLSQTVTGAGTITNNGGTSTLTGNFSGFTGTYIHNSTVSSTLANSTASLSRDAAYHLASSQGSLQGLLTNVTSGNNTFEIGALSGVANSLVRNGTSVTGNTTLRIGDLNTDTLFAGIIGGGGGTLGITKVGTGTLTLSGTSPYSGPTHIHRGMLMLTGFLTGNSQIHVANGGILAGVGSANGGVSVAPGGILAPGNGAGGTLTLSGPLTLENGSQLHISIGSTSSSLSINGNLNQTGITTVHIDDLDGFTTGTYPILTGAGSISTANFALGAAPEGYVCLLHASAGTLSLTVALPPSTPAQLSATGSQTDIALSWIPSPGASHYTVKRSTIGHDGYELIATVFGPAYNDSSASNGVIYSYVVTAWNAAGESAVSNEASAGLATSIAAWRHLHFGTVQNEGNAADTFDADGDGLSNLLEYALGSDPTSANATALPQVVDSTDKLTITFSRNAFALDAVLSVWGSDDLTEGSWQEIARGTGGAAFTNVVDGVPTGAVVNEMGSGASRSVVVSDLFHKQDPEHPKRFLRLQVEQ
jgi:autotransporter-associated beta strand protein